MVRGVSVGREGADMRTVMGQGVMVEEESFDYLRVPGCVVGMCVSGWSGVCGSQV